MTLSNSRSSDEYTGLWNWGLVTHRRLASEDHNEARHVLAYRQQALNNVDSYNDILKSIEESLPFQLHSTGACTKEEASSLRKLWDRNTKFPGHADHITDYLRATITVPTGRNGVNNLRRVIDTLINHPSVLAYKDQFFEPEPETGYRSFKALIDVNGHIAELMVQYEAFEPAEKITKTLRDFERAVKEFQDKAPKVSSDKRSNDGSKNNTLAKLTTNAATMISEIRVIRKQVHEAIAEDCGLNSLLSPRLKEMSQPNPLSKLVETFRHAHDNRTFGKGLEAAGRMLATIFPDFISSRPR